MTKLFSCSLGNVFLFPELELKQNLSKHRDLIIIYVCILHALTWIFWSVFGMWQLHSVLNDIVNYMVHKITTKII